MLQAPNGTSRKIWDDRQVKDLIYQIWLANTDKFGVLTHTLRTMYRLPIGSVENVGNAVYARGTLTRSQLLYYAYLRRGKPAPGFGSKEIGFPTIHETS